MHFNVILEPGGWLSCQTLLLTILILTKLNIQKLKFQTTGSMTRTANEGVTCKPLLLPHSPIPPSFCIKKEKKNNGDQNITPIITCCQKAFTTKIGECKAMTRLNHSFTSHKTIILYLLYLIEVSELTWSKFCTYPRFIQKLNLSGKSHTTSTIYFNLNIEISIHIPNFCYC